MHVRYVQGFPTNFTNLGSTDLADTGIPGLRAGLTEGAEGLGLALLRGDGTGSLSGVGVGDGEGLAGGGSSEIVTLFTIE